MKLHYSQTMVWIIVYDLGFQYLMKLHYSQTLDYRSNRGSMFQYLMKLHYSQTYRVLVCEDEVVSVPYEITLLSNCSISEAYGYGFQYLMKLHYSQTR